MIKKLLFLQRQKKVVWQAAFFILSFYIFCLVAFVLPLTSVDEFSDLGNYAQLWDSIGSTPILEITGRYEPGFVAFCAICSMVMSFSAFTWFVQFLVFYSLFLFASRYSRQLFVAALLAGACLTYYLPLTSVATLVIRQGLATAVFFLYLARHHGGSVPWKTALPWVFTMVLFHYSAVFVIIALILVRFLRRLSTFYLWCLAMVCYVLDLSGQVGLFFYGAMGLSVASLNALSTGIEYQVGFKLNFLLLNLFYVVVPILLNWFGIIRTSIRSMFSDDLFRIYFALNALATVFSLMPFYDRFFLWSWVIGPVLLLQIFFESVRTRERVA